ncbi:MAG: exodeoxyribonuclease V subunit alpha [Deltaproteobacteria bacterium]|nr:exodeoxyribonuclease V subunit alpha [Deltaproteobacteria bacterium]
MAENTIQHLPDSGLFSEIDLAFADLMIRLSENKSPELYFSAALASRATSGGHVCLNLQDMADRPLAETGDPAVSFVCPPLDRWLRFLERTDVVGKPGAYRPLILDRRGRLYLYRYWQYEDRLARALTAMAGDDAPGRDDDLLKKGLAALFAPSTEGETDWQKVAVYTAVTKRLCVISGGPGTGKSTVISKILCLYAHLCRDRKMSVALAAPTGKAAARLREAVMSGMGPVPRDFRLGEALVPQAGTIHRLLGSITGSPSFRHNADNPVSAGLVVIDEASMVDLALMAKLVDALPRDGRLVLLGDRDQLASVQAGAVLADICPSERIPVFSNEFRARYGENACETIPAARDDDTGPGMPDCLVQLSRSYRFGTDSGIGALSRAVNRGDGKEAFHILQKGKRGDIGWRSLPPAKALKTSLKDLALEHFAPVIRADDPVDALSRLSRFRVLCALRKGPYGLEKINNLVEKLLGAESLIGTEGAYYHGRPVLINANDYARGLFNGDVGIVWKDPGTEGALRAFFVSPDQTLRKFLPAALPPHDTAYAMTVHKSQGSEFYHALLLLPDTHSPVLTRELVYTGITRARNRVEVWGSEPVFVEAVRRRTKRTSGLGEALWGPEV